jgi:hypothetical protein
MKEKRGDEREEVVAGAIYLLCVGASLLPVGIIKVANVGGPYVSLVSFFSYLFAAISLILLLLEFLSFFLDDDEE